MISRETNPYSVDAAAGLNSSASVARNDGRLSNCFGINRVAPRRRHSASSLGFVLPVMTKTGSSAVSTLARMALSNNRPSTPRAITQQVKGIATIAHAENTILNAGLAELVKQQLLIVDVILNDQNPDRLVSFVRPAGCVGGIHGG
jgi:hypothetical protein